jgi:hypothetical protein
MKELTIISPAFESNKSIPSKYTCDGDDVNPTLNIEGTPEETKSLILLSKRAHYSNADSMFRFNTIPAMSVAYSAI